MAEEKQQTLDTFGKVDRRELPRLNLRQYVGQITTIERYAERRDKNGRPYVLIETAPVVVLHGDNNTTKEIRASVILGLYEDKNGVYIGVGSKADKFLQSFNVPHWKYLIGKQARIQIQMSRKGENREFLTFIAP